ncbi:hypothetical protein [Stenotrophomonas sp. CFBP 13718]|uniref:hypothetical protein n=1 Tax=Stenotrophomonas sp. CFBP 13718 TaxID=2775304 RepID=UPI00177D40C0|nr:hypothetical protein [Stenotrophomonas sp. CFBP 13718]MBD8696579.1 hypothetical protein [Stenotrophomonas sp. CFBP 13718]
MADPVNYCSWFYGSFCISQSEWATWTQAGLTVVTFAIALITQHNTDARAAKQKAKADAALLEEKLRAAEDRRSQAESSLANEKAQALLRSRATAISLHPELLNFESVLEAIIRHGPADSPAEEYELIVPNLDIRHRPFEAMHIPTAAEALLTVTDAANRLHNYLDACKTSEQFGPSEMKYIDDLAQESLPKVIAAQEAVQVIARGWPAHAERDTDHAAS